VGGGGAGRTYRLPHEGKGRRGKGRGREGKGREGKGKEGGQTRGHYPSPTDVSYLPPLDVPQCVSNVGVAECRLV
jgi:hypothetical protein